MLRVRKPSIIPRLTSLWQGGVRFPNIFFSFFKRRNDFIRRYGA